MTSMLTIVVLFFISITTAIHPECDITLTPDKIFRKYSGGSEKVVDFYTIGDSHSLCATPNLFEKSGNVRWHKHHMGAKLMYSVGRDGLELLNVRRMVGEYPMNSIAMFSFGAIDTRRQIHLYQDKGVGNVMEDLVEKYERVLLQNEAMVPGMKFWILDLPPPCARNPRFINNTIRMNDLLREMCLRNSWYFLETYNDYKDKHGYLDWEKSDYKNHIGAYLPVTQQKVADEIEKIRKLL